MNATEITSYSAFKVADEPETVLITLILLLGQGHPVVATAAECWLKLDGCTVQKRRAAETDVIIIISAIHSVYTEEDHSILSSAAATPTV